MKATQPPTPAPAVRNSSPRHQRIEEKSKSNSVSVPDSLASKNQWFQTADPETGRIYFYHGITMEVSWKDPRKTQGTTALPEASDDSPAELPALDLAKLKSMFDVWDRDQSGSIGERELFQWMKAVNRNMEPTIETAQQLIKAHDSDGNGQIDYKELKAWVLKGKKYSAEKRSKLRRKSEVHRHAINFLERLIMACPEDAAYVPSKPGLNTAKHYVPDPDNIQLPATASKDLPNINLPNLRKQYQRWDLDGDGSIDVLELLSWMQELHNPPAPAPDKASAETLIATHDIDGDQTLQWREFQAWVAKGSKLSIEKRNMYRRRGIAAHLALNFLESLVWICSGKAAPVDLPPITLSKTPGKSPTVQKAKAYSASPSSPAEMDMKTSSPLLIDQMASLDGGQAAQQGSRVRANPTRPRRRASMI